MEKEPNRKRSAAPYITLVILSTVIAEAVGAFILVRRGYSGGDTLSPDAIRIIAGIEGALSLAYFVIGIFAAKARKGLGIAIIVLGVLILAAAIAVYSASGSLNITVM